MHRPEDTHRHPPCLITALKPPSQSATAFNNPQRQHQRQIQKFLHTDLDFKTIIPCRNPSQSSLSDQSREYVPKTNRYVPRKNRVPRNAQDIPSPKVSSLSSGNALQPVTLPSQTRAQDSTVTKSCNCFHSRCLKKYCECFKIGKECNQNCNCFGCKNRDGQSLKLPRKQLSSCKCFKIRCDKKYCACFNSNQKCSQQCRCLYCSNKVQQPAESGPGQGEQTKA